MESPAILLRQVTRYGVECTKSMQAMLYQYDQLHRIVRSRSLASYAAASGFAAPTGAYDEDYTYDPNGNILTLQRKNEAGGIADDFDYVYYANTNRLREVVPVTKDKVYSSGPVRTDNIVYRNVTINGSAYVPQGSSVEVKALENILMDPAFESPDGTDFWAHILADEGTYQYDAIGNLILDQSEGVQISWTPYGKVREVHTKGDSIVVYFRYDGTGNRVEKKVVRRDTVSNVVVTRYVRDVSGKMLAIYKDTVMTEQPIYGSGRVGQYMGTRNAGRRTLGEREFELSNHLSNVLVVITNHVGIEEDSAWATVASARDYYPFGLEMQGRMYTDTTASYRYGFNGKEKDGNGELGDTHYDYGFRIYNPVIGRFLSVDSLTATYPSWSPYPFAMNRPIDGVDLDGKEWDKSTDSQGNTNISVKIEVENKTNLSQEDLDKYYAAASEKLNRVLQSSSNNRVSGKISFDGNSDATNQIVPSLTLVQVKYAKNLKKKEVIVAAQTTLAGIDVNLYNKDNQLKSPEQFAGDLVHDLLHTLRLNHPFEYTQTADTKLIHSSGNDFSTYLLTDPDIYYNILNYSMININGLNLGELWKTRPPEKLTSGQIQLMINEIDLQKSGVNYVWYYMGIDDNTGLPNGFGNPVMKDEK